MSMVAVANTAGVSTATVSRVINGHASVKPELVQLVREAMRELGYTPPEVRRGPKRGARAMIRTGNVGLLVAERHAADLYGMPVFPSLLHGLQSALTEEGLRLVLLSLLPDRSLPDDLSPQNLDGIFIVEGLEPVEALRSLPQRLPAVWLMRGNADGQWARRRVLYNNDAVGQIAARYLLGRGHTSLAFLNASPDHPAFKRRQSVFADAARQANSTLHEFVSSPSSSRSVLAEQASLVGSLAEAEPRPTGLFVPCDAQLPGVYHALELAGIAPGRDIEVIGCDNERMLLAQLLPRPASIDIHLSQVGVQGVQQLLQRIANPDERNGVTLLVEPTLVEPAEPSSPDGPQENVLKLNS